MSKMSGTICLQHRVGACVLIAAAFGCGDSETYILPSPMDTVVASSVLPRDRAAVEMSGSVSSIEQSEGNAAEGETSNNNSEAGLDAASNSVTAGEPSLDDELLEFERPWATGGGARPAASNSLFALSSRLRTAGGLVSYLFLARDLSTDLNVSDAALSFESETVLAVGPERGGTVFLTTPNRSLTRYQLDVFGRLEVQGQPLDFRAELGGGNFGEYGSAFQFVRQNRAYYFHRDRLILWDPSSMAIEGSVYYGGGPESGGIYREGYATTFSALPQRRGSELYVVAGWHDAGVILPETALIRVNVQTDEVVIVSDTRCAFAREGVWGADGKLYLASEAYAAAVYFDDSSKAPAPCMIRFDPVTGQFDPEFFEERLFGGDPATSGQSDIAFGSLQAGPNGSAFLRVLDPELAVATVDGARFLSSAEPVWRWARVTLSSAPLVSLLDIAPSGGSAVPFVLGDRVFSPSFTFEWIIEGVVRSATSTQMVELTAGGPTTSRFSFPGQSFAAFAVQ